MEEILGFIKPEMMILIPALWVIGQMVKYTEQFPNRYIPLFLGFLGIFLCSINQMATQVPKTGTELLSLLFFSITQGITCAGLAVYGDQLVKQMKKGE